MDSLPNEVVAYLFDFLTKQDGLFARLVCQRWKSFIPRANDWVRSDLHEYLIQKGYFNLLDWVVKEMRFTKNLIDAAVSSGDMEMIQYVDRLGMLNVPVVSMPRQNALRIMKFLLEEKGLPLSKFALLDAMSNEDVELVDYLYSKRDFSEEVGRVLIDATLRRLPEMVIWAIEKGAKIDYSSCEYAIRAGSPEVLEIYMKSGSFDRRVHKLMVLAIVFNTLPCVKYLHTRMRSPWLAEMQEETHNWIASWTEGTLIHFLYIHNYLPYNDALRKAVINEKEAYELLSWLRGENEYLGSRLNSVPHWPDDIRVGDLGILKWLHSKERIYGLCPWEVMNVVVEDLEMIKYLRGYYGWVGVKNVVVKSEKIKETLTKLDCPIPVIDEIPDE